MNLDNRRKTDNFTDIRKETAAAARRRALTDMIMGDDISKNREKHQVSIWNRATSKAENDLNDKRGKEWWEADAAYIPDYGAMEEREAEKEWRDMDNDISNGKVETDNEQKADKTKVSKPLSKKLGF